VGVGRGGGGNGAKLHPWILKSSATKVVF